MNTCEDFIFLHGSKIKIVSVTSFVLMKARPGRVGIATPACVWIVGVTVREKLNTKVVLLQIRNNFIYNFVLSQL